MLDDDSSESVAILRAHERILTVSCMTEGINFVKSSFASSLSISPYLEESLGLIALVPYMLWTIIEIVGRGTLT